LCLFCQSASCVCFAKAPCYCRKFLHKSPLLQNSLSKENCHFFVDGYLAVGKQQCVVVCCRVLQWHRSENTKGYTTFICWWVSCRWLTSRHGCEWGLNSLCCSVLQCVLQAALQCALHCSVRCVTVCVAVCCSVLLCELLVDGCLVVGEEHCW